MVGYSPWGHKELDTTTTLTALHMLSRNNLRYNPKRRAVLSYLVGWLLCFFFFFFFLAEGKTKAKRGSNLPRVITASQQQGWTQA